MLEKTLRASGASPFARESGQAITESIIAVLIMLIIGLAGVDIGKYALAWASCDQAATESVRALMSDPSSIETSDTTAAGAVADAAFAASPNLDPSATNITYRKIGDVQQTYTHHFSDSSSDGGTVDRAGSVADLHTATLTLTTKTGALTLLGPFLGAENGKYTITIVREFQYDTTAASADKGGGKW